MAMGHLGGMTSHWHHGTQLATGILRFTNIGEEVVPKGQRRGLVYLHNKIHNTRHQHTHGPVLSVSVSVPAAIGRITHTSRIDIDTTRPSASASGWRQRQCCIGVSGSWAWPWATAGGRRRHEAIHWPHGGSRQAARFCAAPGRAQHATAPGAPSIHGPITEEARGLGAARTRPVVSRQSATAARPATSPPNAC